MNKSEIGAIHFDNFNDFLHVFFWVLLKLGEEADGFVVVTKPQVDDLDAQLLVNLQLLSPSAHLVGNVDALELHESLEVLPGSVDDFVVHGEAHIVGRHSVLRNLLLPIQSCIREKAHGLIHRKLVKLLLWLLHLINIYQ